MKAPPNAAQIAYWNESAGERWARLSDRIDAAFAPVAQAALGNAAPRAGETVLDIGCGCGATTFALAQRVGSGAAVVGVDVSEPMLGIAKARAQAFGAGNVRFVLGDAALHSFEAGATGYVSIVALVKKSGHNLLSTYRCRTRLGFGITTIR